MTSGICKMIGEHLQMAGNIFRMTGDFHQHDGFPSNMKGISINMTAKSLTGQVWARLLAECSLLSPEKVELFRGVNVPQFQNKKQ